MTNLNKKILVRIYGKDVIDRMEKRKLYLGLSSMTAYINWLINADLNKFEDKGEK